MSAKKPLVLVAEDDPQMIRLITRSLQTQGFETLLANNGQEALDRVIDSAPDLVLLDVMMPKLDGFAVCERVRTFSTVPMIMLTARGQDQEKVRGLDLGVDDYLTKPFNLDELYARVRAVLRRSQFAAADYAGPTQITVGDLVVDLAQHAVSVGGEIQPLTPVEFRLLAYLANHAGRVVTQDALLEHVWGQSYVGEGHMLQVAINRLRRKIEPDPNAPRYIITRVGVGYMVPAPALAAS
jgi:DNA-binding response OmpR family regulator